MLIVWNNGDLKSNICRTVYSFMFSVSVNWPKWCLLSFGLMGTDYKTLGLGINSKKI